MSSLVEPSNISNISAACVLISVYTIDGQIGSKQHNSGPPSIDILSKLLVNISICVDTSFLNSSSVVLVKSVLGSPFLSINTNIVLSSLIKTILNMISLISTFG